MLTSINGLRISSFQTVQRALEVPKGALVQLVYRREGQENRTTVIPLGEKGLSGIPADWIIGVTPELHSSLLGATRNSE